MVYALRQRALRRVGGETPSPLAACSREDDDGVLARAWATAAARGPAGGSVSPRQAKMLRRPSPARPQVEGGGSIDGPHAEVIDFRAPDSLASQLSSSSQRSGTSSARPRRLSRSPTRCGRTRRNANAVGTSRLHLRKLVGPAMAFAPRGAQATHRQGNSHWNGSCDPMIVGAFCRRGRACPDAR